MNIWYAVLAYRDNGIDTCRGCEMGRSDSAFELFESDDKQEVIHWVAKKYAESSMRDRAVCEWDITVLVNGHSTDRYDDDTVWEQQSSIRTAAEVIAKEIVIEENRKIELAQLEKRTKEEQTRIARELEQLHILQQKYGKV